MALKMTMRQKRLTSESDLRPAIGLFRLSLIAIFVGILTGFGAIAFRGLIGFIHNLFFLGRFSLFYDANSYTPPSMATRKVQSLLHI